MAEYTLYNKKYNYDDLARVADSGINEYISQLKRGNRDFESFKDAYVDMMQGIKDGSITYQDGKFIATTNTDKRRNTDKKYKDYYGLVANYIYNKMLGINEVPEKKPEEPKTFDTKILQQNLLKQIFGNNTKPNVIDFINQDVPVNGVRTRSNRTKLLKQYIENIINDSDNIFKDADEKTKNYQLGLLNDAKEALKDNDITDNDILALSRVFNGIDFNQMLTNKVPESEQEVPVQEVKQEIKQEVKQEKPINILDYSNFINNKGYGDITKRGGIQIIKPTDSDYSKYKSIYDQFINTKNISNNSPFKLVTDQVGHKIVRVKPNNFNGKYMYFYKDTKSGNIYRIVSKSYQDLYNEYKSSIQSKRNGGIIKAQSGINTEDLYTYTDEDAKWDLGNLYNALYDKPLNERSQWVSGSYNNQNSGVYGASKGYNYNKDSNNIKTNIEGNKYYKKFGESLFNSNDELTPVGQAYVKKLNELINDPSAKILNSNGTPKNTWTVKVKTLTGTTNRTYNKLREYIEAIRNDTVLGPAHNVFMKKGTRYYIKDNNGNKQYVKPNDLDRFIKGNSEEILNGDTIWTDIELLSPEDGTPKEEPKIEQQGDSSFIKTRNEVAKPNNLQNVLQEVIPNALQLGKYLSNLRSNKKVENTLLDSLIPVTLNPYEVYSPVHGDWRNMVYWHQKAKDLRRQVSNMATADQEKNIATYLTADKQGAEYENQGNQLYDKMWLETLNRALQNTENNTKVRNAIANENIKNMANYWANRGQIKAGRIQSDQASTNNLYDYLANYFNDRIDKRRQFVLANEQNRLLQEYNNKRSELQYQLMGLMNDSGDITNNAKYLDLKRQLQDLDLWYKDNINKTASRIYGFNI